MTSTKEGVSEVVQRLHDEYGEVRASQLVESARAADSPAHDGLEWDDRKASEEYRLNQARQWLRAVYVVVDNKSEPLWHVPSVRGEDGPEGIYRVESVVVTIIDETERAMEQLAAALRNAEDNVNRFRLAIERNATPQKKAQAARLSRGLRIMQDALGRGRKARPARKAKSRTSRARKAR